MKNTWLIVLFAFAPVLVSAQDIDFEKLAAVSKRNVDFPLDYKISRPRLEFPDWDGDYDAYNGFLTPTIRKTQMALSSTQNGVTTTWTPNSIKPHAQLDTATMVTDEGRLAGTWRMLKFRAIRYNDSVYVPTKTYYRLPDSLLDDKSMDEAFAIISQKHLRMYAKESGSTRFKKMPSGKYSIEGRRFLIMYKLLKGGGGVSQFGIDEKGYLIINYPTVIENVKQGAYFSYYTVIHQYIFERVQ
jgi:hypothetical protein